jgi:hypothetical protein
MVHVVAALLLLAVEPASPPPAAEAAASPEVNQAEPAAVAPPAAAEPAPATAPSPAPAPTAATEPAPAQAPAPAPAAPVATPAPVDPNAPVRFYASLGIGRAWPGGEVFADLPMNDLTSPMPQFELTLGFRITPRWLVGIYLDAAGGGTPGAVMRATCGLDGEECSTFSTQAGVEGRYVFDPAAKRTWWAGVGLGGETTGTTLKDSKADRPYLTSYSGGVFPRLSGGWDRRVNRYWGWGFYGTLSFGRFNQVATGGADPVDLPNEVAGHSWLGLGVRAILFP